MSHSCGTWYPTVFPDKCDGCANLEKPRRVEFCSNGVFAFQNGKPVVMHPDKCLMGCSAREAICHKKAIAFPKRQRIFVQTESGDKKLRKTACAKCGKSFWTNRDSNVYMDCGIKQ